MRETGRSPVQTRFQETEYKPLFRTCLSNTSSNTSSTTRVGLSSPSWETQWVIGVDTNHPNLLCRSQNSIDYRTAFSYDANS